MERPVYLHFLQKDLRREYNASIDDNSMLRFILISAFLSDNFLYCNNAMFWENAFDFPQSIKLLQKLCGERIVYTLTNFSSPQEFHSNRATLYKEDSYFKVNYDHYEDKYWNVSNILIPDSTTKLLRTKLFQYQDSETIDNYTREVIIQGLEKRDQAVTYSLFENYVDRNKIKENNDLRSFIAKQYYLRYKKIYSAITLEGVPNYKILDIENDYTLCTNYNVIYQFLLYLGIINENHLSPDDIYYTIALYKHDVLFLNIIQAIQMIISGLHFKAKKETPKLTFEQMLFRQINNLRYPCSYIKLNESATRTALYRLEGIINSQFSNSYFKEGFNIMREQLTGNKNRFLILCAKRSELKILYNTFKGNDIDLHDILIGKFPCLVNRTFSDKMDIYVAITGQGSGGIAGSLLSIEELLKIVTPTYVVMVGMLMGTKPEKQRYNELVIASQIFSYEQERINPDSTISRGDKITASPYLLKAFDQLAFRWDNCVIHTGLVVSGEKLVNSPEFRSSLLEKEPEAIGCEMEGAALAACCVKNNVDWALIKGICDFGENKTKEYQESACLNASEFLIQALKTFYI